MSFNLLIWILISVLLSAFSQILLKAGMVSPAVRKVLFTGYPLGIVIMIPSTPIIILGFLCFGLSLLIWLTILSRIPLSTAYPFVALGIAVTVVAGVTLFGETLSFQKVAGVILILVGILTVASA